MTFGALTCIKPEPPFILSIPSGGLRAGSQVVIEGFVPSSWSHRFDINLVVGSEPTQEYVAGADIAFHFNPRFDEGQTVLNTRIGGDWGSEVREMETIRKGDNFQVLITAEQDYYNVTVNGRYVANFAHRIPVNTQLIVPISIVLTNSTIFIYNSFSSLA